MKDSKLLNKEIVLSKYGKKFVKETLEMKDGVIMDWYYLDSPDSVLVVPITRDNEVIMISQYRHNIKKQVNEFPAGYVFESTSIEETVKKELEEETGYTSDTIIPLGRFYNMPSETNRWVNIFLAKDVVKMGEPELDTLIEKYFNISVNVIDLEDIKKDPSLIQGIEHGYALSLALKHLEKTV